MKQKSAGFTLVEILVAVAIFGLLSVGAYTVLDAGMRSQKQTESRLSGLQTLQRTIQSIETDLRMLSQRQVRDEFGDKVSLLRGQSDLSGQAGFLEFTHSGWQNPAGLPRSNLQHVIYNFKQGKLNRLHTIFLDQATNSPKVVRLLVEHLSTLNLAFLDDEGQWKNTWGMQSIAGNSQPLPRAVRINIELEPFGLIERIIPISTVVQSTENDGAAGD